MIIQIDYVSLILESYIDMHFYKYSTMSSLKMHICIGVQSNGILPQKFGSKISNYFRQISQ